MPHHITQWKTIGGEIIDIAAMSNGHLVNAIVHTRDKFSKLESDVAKKSRTKVPTYPGATIWGMVVRTNRLIDSYEALCYEAGRRGLVINHQIEPPDPKDFIGGEGVIPVVDTLPRHPRAKRHINT